MKLQLTHEIMKSHKHTIHTHIPYTYLHTMYLLTYLERHTHIYIKKNLLPRIHQPIAIHEYSTPSVLQQLCRYQSRLAISCKQSIIKTFTSSSTMTRTTVNNSGVPVKSYEFFF